MIGRKFCGQNDESKFEIFGFNKRIYERLSTKENMFQAVSHPVKQRGGNNILDSFGAGKVGGSFRMKGILSQHGYHSICHGLAFSSGLLAIGASFTRQRPETYMHKPSVSQGINLFAWVLFIYHVKAW